MQTPVNAPTVAQLQALRAAKIAAHKQNAHNYKQDFMMTPHWRELASQYGVRLSAWYYPPTETRLRRMMKKLGLTNDRVRWELNGPLSSMITMNPTWPCYALEGLLLEMVAYG